MNEAVSGGIEHLRPGQALSQAVITGGVAYLAGQVSVDGSTTIEGQTQSVLVSLDQLLEELESSKENLLSVQIWLKSIDDFEAMNQVWCEWLDGAKPPARATGQVLLADPDWLIEVIAVAAVPR